MRVWVVAALLQDVYLELLDLVDRDIQGVRVSGFECRVWGLGYLELLDLVDRDIKGATHGLIYRLEQPQTPGFRFRFRFRFRFKLFTGLNSRRPVP